jgi:hypothetical protein
VEFVDIFSSEMDTHRPVLDLLVARNLPLPLIAINDEPRFVGGISLDGISQALEADGLVSPVELLER